MIQRNVDNEYLKAKRNSQSIKDLFNSLTVKIGKWEIVEGDDRYYLKVKFSWKQKILSHSVQLESNLRITTRDFLSLLQDLSKYP